MAKTDPITVPLELDATTADVEALIRYGRDSAVAPPVTNPDGSITHFLGKDVQRVVVPAVNPVLPTFVAQSETVVEPASFIAYITDFKSPTAICKASLKTNSIVAVLDYHGRAREAGEAAVPGRGAHQVVLQCPYDLDYAKWKKAFSTPFDQKQLAEFIEDMIHTISRPAAADLLEAIGDMKIDRAVRFRSARNDRNGNVAFTYEEVDVEHPDSGVLTLPEHIQIVVPIFQGGISQAFEVRLRFRMDKGVVTFLLSVPGLDKEEREAFRRIGEEVREKTATQVYYVA